MALPNAVIADYRSDDRCNTTKVGDLVARDLEHIDVPFILYAAENSTTAGAPATLLAWDIPIPDYVGTLYINLKFESYVSLASGYVRLQNTTDGLNGTWQLVTAVAYPNEVTDKVQIGASADTDRLTNIEVEGYHTVGGTIYARSTLGLTAWFSVT